MVVATTRNASFESTRKVKSPMSTKVASNVSLTVVIMATIAISGCRVYDEFYSSMDKSVDFTSYRTYAWMSPNAPADAAPYYNDVIQNNAKNFVDREFKSRGYSVDTVKPDVLVELRLKKEKVKETVENVNPYSYTNHTYSNYPYNQRYHDNVYYREPRYNSYPYYNYNTPYSYYPEYSTDTIQYTEGTITINVIDRNANKLVWTGSAEGDIYDPRHLKGEIDPAVDGIMKQYPTKPLKNDE